MKPTEPLQQLRREYQHAQLDLSVDQNPFVQFKLWLDQAIAAQLIDATAMVLATADKHNQPSARVVLLKGIEDNQLIFYTHYQSHKGLDIAQNPQVAVNFYWAELERQVIIQGKAKRLPNSTSDHYFQSRPRESQLATHLATQSQPIDSREFLLEQQQKYREQFADKAVPRPENWGGYAITPHFFEFWQGRENRIHDRIAYSLNKTVWEVKRLSP